MIHWHVSVTVCVTVSHGYAHVTRDLINIIMPREIITIQLGQCGNQGKNIAQHVCSMYC